MIYIAHHEDIINGHKRVYSPSYCGRFLALTPTILAMAEPLRSIV